MERQHTHRSAKGSIWYLSWQNLPTVLVLHDMYGALAAVPCPLPRKYQSHVINHEISNTLVKYDLIRVDRFCSSTLCCCEAKQTMFGIPSIMQSQIYHTNVKIVLVARSYHDNIM